eukprot:GFUD01028840.1.p1 GENE.GFUD01028840.1~~GFUD01028840.1.p1  ORF type:complete len:122 (-),score=0.50 GFUD01028840.1:9-374(-)
MFLNSEFRIECSHTVTKVSRYFTPCPMLQVWSTVKRRWSFKITVFFLLFLLLWPCICLEWSCLSSTADLHTTVLCTLYNVQQHFRMEFLFESVNECCLHYTQSFFCLFSLFPPTNKMVNGG